MSEVASAAQQSAVSKMSESERVHEVMRLICTNKFGEVEAMVSHERQSVPRMAYLYVMIEYLKAISVQADGDLNAALAVIWEAEKLGAALASDDSDPGRQIEGKLLQADAYLLGATIQFTQESLVKSCWNMRVSWGLYCAAENDLKNYRVRTPPANDSAFCLALLLTYCTGTGFDVRRVIGLVTVRHRIFQSFDQFITTGRAVNR